MKNKKPFHCLIKLMLLIRSGSSFRVALLLFLFGVPSFPFNFPSGIEENETVTTVVCWDKKNCLHSRV